MIIKTPLNFIVDWGSNRAKAWSGTNNSIFTALKQFYSVRDIPTKPESSIHKAFRKLGIVSNDLNYANILKNRKLLNSISGPIFQFAEILETAPNRPTYIYQDLCVDYLNTLRLIDPATYRYSRFDNVDLKAMEQRNRLQIEYYKTATSIFTMGHWLSDFFKDRHPDIYPKVFQVGAGINLNPVYINPSKHKRNNKILFIGRDFVRKGGRCVIDAFRIIKNQYDSNVELHIAGPRINPLSKLEKGYFFYGDSDRETLQKLMNICDVFCMPSYFEAYGLVFIEALTFGLPCIGRSCYEMPYFIDRGITGELLQSDSAKELADIIMTVLSKSSYKQNVEARREYYLNQYSWSSVARRIANIINQ